MHSSPRSASSKTSVASWYPAFAHRNTVGQPFILFPDLMYETAEYSDGAFNSEIQIRFATRAVYPYFDSRHTDVFRFEAFLEAAIDCRYSSFRFLFTLPPLYAPFPCPVHVPPRTKPRCKIRARSCDFSEQGFVRADDPRKEIKSAAGI